MEKATGSIFDLENIAFMGTHVISGSGMAILLRTGDGKHCIPPRNTQSLIKIDSFMATIMKELEKKRPINSFQRSIRQVSYMLGSFAAVLFPIVSVIEGICVESY
jgi:Mg2+-importing ATPase